MFFLILKFDFIYLFFQMKKINTNNGMLKKILIFAVWIAIIMLFCTLFCKKSVMICPSVKEYLAVADFKWEWIQVKKWDEIVVDYIWRLKDGTVFDTSIEQVAKWCDKYNEARDYSQGLWFIVWAGQMIAGFDRGVEWMKIWQTKTIEIAPSDAYGEKDESLFMTVKKSQLQSSDQYKEWDVLYAPNWQAVKVHKVTKDEVILDANHELAWQTLIFDITIKEIK